MNEPLVDKIARALLYEGYVLYPYRPSAKNQQRWTFGGIYPPTWSAAQDGTDACFMQTQCLLETGNASVLRVRIRFLHLVDRTIGRLLHPVNELPNTGEPEFQNVQSMEVDQRHVQAWQEAVEREVDMGDVNIHSLLVHPCQKIFSFPSYRIIEPLRAPGSPIAAILIREQREVNGAIALSAAPVQDNIVRISVRILNTTEMENAGTSRRDDALMRALISTHTILDVSDGSFVSQTDPPPPWRHYATQCANIGAWPVLVGDSSHRGTMLSSPIIVEDYPKIAPESPGDLFDGGEIDEILTLRIMTLTDEEKRLAAGIDDRVRDVFARTQSLARDQLMSLHGTLREVIPVMHTPAENHAGISPVKKITVDGIEMKPGDSVRLHPLGRADVMDIALDGKIATIVSIEQDFENRIYVAVTVDEDPGKDLGFRGQPGHRFFFGIEEVELLTSTQVPH